MKIKKDKLKLIVDLCIEDIELDLRNKKLTIFFNPKCISLLFGGMDAQEA